VKRALPGGYELDDDPRRLDLEAVHRYLSVESYWAKGRSLEIVDRLAAEAARVLGLYHGELQVGYCRAVSDGIALAYLADVYVLPEDRGHGLGKETGSTLLDHPDLKGLRRVMLATADAHDLYRAYGFTELEDPSRMMVIHNNPADIYDAG